MPRCSIRASLFLFATMLISSQACALDVLFIGNSFTHIPVEQTHANGTRGMPAIFSRLADQGNHAVNVSMDAPSGRPLKDCLAASAPALSTRWDVVVLQDVSFQTLETARLLDFHAAITGLSSQFRTTNPDTDIYLFQTWSYPAMLDGKNYGDTLAAIQEKISAAYQDAATRNQLAGVVPVGDAFLYASDNNLASYGDTGGFSFWGTDNYHQSVAGAYLTSVLFYHRIFGEDIASIPTGADSVAAGLGLTSGQAALVHRIAAAVAATAVVPESSSAAICISLATLVIALLGIALRMNCPPAA